MIVIFITVSDTTMLQRFGICNQVAKYHFSAYIFFADLVNVSVLKIKNVFIIKKKTETHIFISVSCL